MKMTGARAKLAEAIAIRNEAIKVKDEARAAFVAVAGREERSFRQERSGEKHGALQSERYATLRNLEELEEKRTQMEKGGSDRVSVHRVFITDYGHDADVIIGKARDELQDFEKRLAALQAAMMKIDIVLSGAEDRLAFAERDTPAAVDAVMDEVAQELQVEVFEAAKVALGKISALNNALRHVNWLHRDYWATSHPLARARTLASLFNNFVSGTSVADERAWINAALDAGGAPWIASRVALNRDASALLPTDPAPKPARAVA